MREMKRKEGQVEVFDVVILNFILTLSILRRDEKV